MRRLNWSRLRDQCIVALAALVFAGVAIWLIGHVIGIVALVAIAVVLALVLEPLMVLAERHMPRLVAALAAYAIFLGALALVAVFLGPALFHQALSLASQLPADLSRLDGQASRQAARLGITVPPGTVSGLAGGALGGLQGGSQNLAGELTRAATSLFEAMADVVLVLVLAFYFMVDGARMRAGFARLFPQKQRPKVRFVEEVISVVLGAYVRAQLVMAVILAASAGIGCWLLGVRYPAVIAALAFLAELIPLVGPFLAAIPAMLIALAQSFGLMVEVTFFFLIMQTLENAVIRPRVTGPTVGLHPIEALLALVVGAATAGFWGALFAVPALGIGVILVSVGFKAWRGEPIEFERHGIRLRMLTPEELAHRDQPGPRPPP